MSWMPALRFPAWIDRGNRGYWNGRDLRGHYTTAETIDEPCPHACCRGLRRSDRPTVRRVKDRGFDGPRWVPRKQAPERQREAKGRALRHDYALYLEAHYEQADAQTRGNMVTAAGRARGYTGADFFKPGHRPSVEHWGSEELRGWFGSGSAAAVGRGRPRAILNLTDFAASQREQETT